MIADCVDCGRVELHRGRCPRCGGDSWMIPGGIQQRPARRFPWLRKLKAVRPAVTLQRGLAAFERFRRKG